MANAIAKFKKYIDLLDEVFASVSTTAEFESPAELVRAGTNANEILVPKMTMDGLGDYSRQDGYAQGSVTLEYETKKFNYERGRKFTIDNMDNEETAGVAFGKLASEFIRTKVVAEMDAFRYAIFAKVGTKKQETLADGTAVLNAILAGLSAMDEAEVPQEDRHLRITPTLLNSVKALDTTKSREALNGFASIKTVPQTRFYTTIKLLSGKDTETAGHFTKDVTGKDVNFMIIHKPSVMQISKHTVNKVITPEENQTSDAYLFFYRAYGLSEVFDNKAKGVYVSYKA